MPKALAAYEVDATVAAESTSQSLASSDVLAATATSGTCVSTWNPNTMTMKMNNSSVSGTRYAQVEFAWNSTTRLQNLQVCPAVTFEPDFVTYNYDGLYYMTKTIKAWSTDMSNGYLDTDFGDSSDERVYTVGTSDATTLNLYRTYYTYVRATNGNSSTDTAKVVAQRGKKSIPLCSSPWCIFAQASVRYPASGWVGIPVSNYTVWR